MFIDYLLKPILDFYTLHLLFDKMLASTTVIILL